MGTDGAAVFLTDALVRRQVDVTHLARVPGPSGTALVFLDPTTKENRIVIIGGANTYRNDDCGLLWANDRIWSDAYPEKEEGEKETTALFRVLQSARVVLLQCEVPEVVNIRAAQVASSHGVPVLLDLGGGDRPLSDDLLRLVTTLSPNETELNRLIDPEEDLLDMDPTHRHEYAAARFLLRGAGEPGHRLRHILLKRGIHGTTLLELIDPKEDRTPPPPQNGGCGVSYGGVGDKEEIRGEKDGYVVVVRHRQESIPAEFVVDTTGAGDAYTAGYAVGVAEGRDVREAMRLGAKVASLVVSRVGAMSSLPTRGEVDAYDA